MWLQKDGMIKHSGGDYCLDVEGLKMGEDLVLKKCEESKSSQLWTFEKYYDLDKKKEV